MIGQHFLVRCKKSPLSSNTSPGLKTAAVTTNVADIDDLISAIYKYAALPNTLNVGGGENRGILRIINYNQYLLVMRSTREVAQCDHAGITTYTHTYIFSGEDKDTYMNNPEVFCNKNVFYSYNELINANNLETEDDIIVNFDENLRRLERGLDSCSTLDIYNYFNEQTFQSSINYFCSSVCSDNSVAVIPKSYYTDNEWKNDGGSLAGEKLMICFYKALPDCLKNMFSGISYFDSNFVAMDGSRSIYFRVYSSLSRLDDISKYQSMVCDLKSNKCQTALKLTTNNTFSSLMWQQLGNYHSEFMKYISEFLAVDCMKTNPAEAYRILAETPSWMGAVDTAALSYDKGENINEINMLLRIKFCFGNNILHYPKVVEKLSDIAERYFHKDTVLTIDEQHAIVQIACIKSILESSSMETIFHKLKDTLIKNVNLDVMSDFNNEIPDDTQNLQKETRNMLNDLKKIQNIIISKLSKEDIKNIHSVIQESKDDIKNNFFYDILIAAYNEKKYWLNEQVNKNFKDCISTIADCFPDDYDRKINLWKIELDLLNHNDFKEINQSPKSTVYLFNLIRDKDFLENLKNNKEKKEDILSCLENKLNDIISNSPDADKYVILFFDAIFPNDLYQNDKKFCELFYDISASFLSYFNGIDFKQQHGNEEVKKRMSKCEKFFTINPKNPFDENKPLTSLNDCITRLYIINSYIQFKSYDEKNRDKIIEIFNKLFELKGKYNSKDFFYYIDILKETMDKKELSSHFAEILKNIKDVKNDSGYIIYDYMFALAEKNQEYKYLIKECPDINKVVEKFASIDGFDKKTKFLDYYKGAEKERLGNIFKNEGLERAIEEFEKQDSNLTNYYNDCDTRDSVVRYLLDVILKEMSKKDSKYILYKQKPNDAFMETKYFKRLYQCVFIRYADLYDNDKVDKDRKKAVDFINIRYCMDNINKRLNNNTEECGVEYNEKMYDRAINHLYWEAAGHLERIYCYIHNEVGINKNTFDLSGLTEEQKIKLAIIRATKYIDSDIPLSNIFGEENMSFMSAVKKLSVMIETEKNISKVRNENYTQNMFNDLKYELLNIINKYIDIMIKNNDELNRNIDEINENGYSEIFKKIFKNYTNINNNSKFFKLYKETSKKIQDSRNPSLKELFGMSEHNVSEQDYNFLEQEQSYTEINNSSEKEDKTNNDLLKEVFAYIFLALMFILSISGLIIFNITTDFEFWLNILIALAICVLSVGIIIKIRREK